MPDKITVLIVEDDELWRNALLESVTDAGIDARTAANWHDAIEAVRSGGLDFLIADLSVASTIEAGVHALDLLVEFHPPKTLIITSAYSEPIVSKCMRHGFVRSVAPKTNLQQVSRKMSDLIGAEINFERTFLKSARNQVRISPAARLEKDTSIVFVVHGRDVELRTKMFAFLRALKLTPLEWEQAVNLTNEMNPYIGDVIDIAMSRARAVVVLLSGDDEARLRSELARGRSRCADTALMPQPRPNVIFEAGYAMGRYPGQTLLVEFGNIRRMSDIFGRHLIRFDGGTASRNALANRLAATGCSIDRSGTDWLSMGIV